MELAEGIELRSFLGEDAVEARSTEGPEGNAFRGAVRAAGGFAVLLAAGKGSRFSSELPKVIHPCRGLPMAAHSMRAARDAGLPQVLVVGHAKDQVLGALRKWWDPKDCAVAEDALRVGTGHAVYVARHVAPPELDGDVVVLYGDNPGINGRIVADLLAHHRQRRAARPDAHGATILTGLRSNVSSRDSAGYGRIIRGRQNEVLDIVEKKQIDRLADDAVWRFAEGVAFGKGELDAVDEFNLGIVAARAHLYFEVLGRVRAVRTSAGPPPKHEFYATDFVRLMRDRGFTVDGWVAPTDVTWRLEGANTIEQLQSLELKMRSADSEPVA